MSKSPFRPTKEMVELARMLRRNETPAERALWNELRGRRFHGFKFRRQHPIDCFVVDFYCPERKLVVEVDGGVHLSKLQQDADAERQAWLEGLGLHVVRVSSDLVLADIRAALQIISRALSPLQW